MTQEELQLQIRNFTKRIGEAKRSSVPEQVERLRLLRYTLVLRLAIGHDVWTLVNPEGRTEFVPLEEWETRVRAWQERRRAESGDSAEVA